MISLKRMVGCSIKQHIIRIIYLSLLTAILLYVSLYTMMIAVLSGGSFFEILSHLFTEAPVDFIDLVIKDPLLILYTFLLLALHSILPIVFCYTIFISICYILYKNKEDNNKGEIK